MAEITAGDYTNTVVVTSTTPDPTPDNNTDFDTTEVVTEIELSIVKNFYYIDDDPFTIHLSCSDAFVGGWGEGGANGPVEGVDVNWQIGSWSMLRYNQNGFFKGCGDVVEPQDVPNTAFADGTDSNSPPESE